MCPYGQQLTQDHCRPDHEFLHFQVQDQSRNPSKNYLSKKYRWTLNPWYRFPSGHDLETRWKLPSHLPHKKKYKRYVAPLLVLPHLKSPCAPWHDLDFPEQRPSTRYQSPSRPQPPLEYWHTPFYGFPQTRRVLHALDIVLDGLKRFPSYRQD